MIDFKSSTVKGGCMLSVNSPIDKLVKKSNDTPISTRYHSSDHIMLLLCMGESEYRAMIHLFLANTSKEVCSEKILVRVSWFPFRIREIGSEPVFGVFCWIHKHSFKREVRESALEQSKWIWVDNLVTRRLSRSKRKGD